MIRESKGITLIALSITVIVLLILAGVSIYEGLDVISDVRENKQMTELEMIQHAILEKYTKYKLTGNEQILAGVIMTYDEVEKVIDDINTKSVDEEDITLKQSYYNIGDNPNLDELYYKLRTAQLTELDITKAEDIYIVNYKTGEVINFTQRVTNKGTPLYIYAVSEETN